MPVGNGAVIRAYEEAGIKVSAAQLAEYILLPKIEGYGALNAEWVNNLPYPVKICSFSLIEGKNSDPRAWQQPRNAVIQITKAGDDIAFFRDASALLGAVIPAGGKIELNINNSDTYDYINLQAFVLRRCAVVAIQAWSQS